MIRNHANDVYMEKRRRQTVMDRRMKNEVVVTRNRQRFRFVNGGGGPTFRNRFRKGSFVARCRRRELEKGGRRGGRSSFGTFIFWNACSSIIGKSGFLREIEK
ncbi:hypothetical protein TNCV_2004331 [Trichonephila clavipes]|nr:hypothetical protein TNCV_2004331 [Trichonephila clavipes]